MKIKNNKKIIKKIWELSRESFQNDDAINELKKISIFLNFDLRRRIVIEIVQTSNSSSDMNDYYSYYKIFHKGEYLFSLPFGRFRSLDLKTSEFEELDPIITRKPNNPNLSSNGGDYYEGYRVEKLKNKNIELYKVQFSWALFSEFETQCSQKPEILHSWEDVVALNNTNLI